MMYAIKNKKSGAYIGKPLPILYKKRIHAEMAIKAILRDKYAENRGYKNLGDTLEVVEVALIERSEVNEQLMYDVPAEWEQLGLYP